MNLMFWKKKTGTGEDAENARESLDSATMEQDAAEPDSESPSQETTRPETPVKLGLVARMKLRLSAAIRHFRKTPAFRAGEDHVPDVPDGSEKPVEAADAEPVQESPGMDMPAKPKLVARMKLRLAALARRFRKTPAPNADTDHADSSDESPAPETPAKPGLYMRIKAGFAAFAREIKAPTTSEDHYADSHDHSEGAPEHEHPEDAPEAEPAVRSNKHLFIGGAVGLLVFLLLVGIGFALWPFFNPPQKRWGTKHDITTISSRSARSNSTPGKPQAEIEALKKENAELQARIEALKKELPQRPYAPPARQAGENAPPSSVSGEMVIGNKDPKVTAMSLKEAIEAMNASSGEYDKKPAQ